MEEVNFQKKNSPRKKFYFLIFFLIFLAILSGAYYYFQNQAIVSLNKNLIEDNNIINDNLNSADGTIKWQTVKQSAANYQINIPQDWFAKEIGNDLLISSYDKNQAATPTLRAEILIQLINNPNNQDPELWWAGMQAAGGQKTQVTKNEDLLIDHEAAVIKSIADPSVSVLDTNEIILTNHEKIIYIFNIKTYGYSKKDYDQVLNQIISSFSFPAAPVNLNLNTAQPLSTSTISALNNQDWSWYESNDQGFKIEYPADWHIYSEGPVTGVSDLWQIIFEDKKYQGQEKPRPYIAVSIYKNQPSLNNWFDLQKEALNDNNLLYNYNYKINDLDGIMYSTSGEALGYNFATIFEGRIYRIWSLNSFPADDTLMDYFKMLDSFRLILKN
jgi:hypothetical protein